MVTLYNDDCLNILPTIEDESIDCIICDLPYGTTKCSWDVIIPFDKLWEQYNRIIKPGGAIVLFGTEPFSSYLRLSNIKGFKYDWIWKKSKSGGAISAKYRPINRHEIISVFSKGGKAVKYNPQMTEGEPYTRYHSKQDNPKNAHGVGTNGKEFIAVNDGKRYPITILDFPQNWRQQDQIHPTQKPLELLKYLVLTYSDENSIILDNCMGSGTTGVACKELGRNFIGIEKDKKYFDIAKERIENTMGVQKLW